MVTRIFEVSCRIAFVAVVLMAFMSGRPPAQAQPENHGVQAQQIDYIQKEVEKHERTDDARVEVLQQKLNEQAVSLGELRGEQRGLFAALAVLQVLAMLFQAKRDKGK